jgi:hypothetical protein
MLSSSQVYLEKADQEFNVSSTQTDMDEADQ